MGHTGAQEFDFKTEARGALNLPLISQIIASYTADILVFPFDKCIFLLHLECLAASLIFSGTIQSKGESNISSKLLCKSFPDFFGALGRSHFGVSYLLFSFVLYLILLKYVPFLILSKRIF